MGGRPRLLSLARPFGCNLLQEKRSLCGIRTIQPVDKAAVIEFAHDAAVDDLLQFDLADSRVAARHQALNGYESKWFQSFQSFNIRERSSRQTV